MRTTALTFFGLAAVALQSVAATGWRAESGFSCPSNTANQCTDDEKNGFDWSDLQTGSFSSYKDFNFAGYTCGSSGKRDLNGRTTSGKSISTNCSKDKSSNSFGCDSKNFSVGSLHVSTDKDTDLEFHYNMPDGSVCKQTSSCSSSGSTIQNQQCGGAKSVQVKIPDNSEHEECGLNIHSIGFECGTSTTSIPVPTTTLPTAVASTFSVPAVTSAESCGVPAACSTDSYGSGGCTMPVGCSVPSASFPVVPSVPAISSGPAPSGATTLPVSCTMPASCTTLPLGTGECTMPAGCSSTALPSASVPVPSASVPGASVPGESVPIPSATTGGSVVTSASVPGVTSAPVPSVGITVPGANNTIPEGAASTEITSVEVITSFTTFCPGPTTVSVGDKTFTVTEATTLVITDCDCTKTHTFTSAIPTAPAGATETGAVPSATAPAETGPAATVPAVSLTGSSTLAATASVPGASVPAGTAPAGTAPAGTAPAGTASAGTASAGTASAGTAPAGTAPAASTAFTTIEVTTLFTTFCPGATTIVQGSSTISVTEATTLTFPVVSTVTSAVSTVAVTGGSVPTGSSGETTVAGVSSAAASVAVPSASSPASVSYPSTLPKCLNTWLFTTSCTDNANADCYCPDSDFVTKVSGCLQAWAQDDNEMAQAVEYFLSLCQAHIPSNPAIVSAIPSSITLPAPTGNVPSTTIVRTYTTAVPVTVPAGGSGAGSSESTSTSTSTVVQTMTIPRVTLIATNSVASLVYPTSPATAAAGGATTLATSVAAIATAPAGNGTSFNGTTSAAGAPTGPSATSTDSFQGGASMTSAGLTTFLGAAFAVVLFQL